MRTVNHDGHRVVVRTHYSIEVDGQPLDVHLSVDVDGQVTCHAILAYSYPSAVDIVRRLIEAFPDDFPRRRRGKTPVPAESVGHEYAGHADRPHASAARSQGAHSAAERHPERLSANGRAVQGPCRGGVHVMQCQQRS